MQPADQRPRGDRIQISRDEAMSAHVDDLIRRQKSLRGEAGVTRDRGRHWYFQNWFVFMITGWLAAVAAWGLLEPLFDDVPYVQGQIEQVNVLDTVPERFGTGEDAYAISVPGHGSITIRKQKIWLLDTTHAIKPDGTKEPLDLLTLQVGQTVGVYAQYTEVGGEGIALAIYIVTSPTEPPPAKALLSFRELEARTHAAGLLLFGLTGGLIGLAIGAVDGAVCRLPRRALIAGGVGLVVGFLGGFVSGILANIIYAPLTRLAFEQSAPGSGSLTTFGFMLQLLGRSLAWALAGITMGLGQGIALRSKRLLIYGLAGGLIGGLLGGLLFDPIDLLLLGSDRTSGHWSRFIGFSVVGAGVGAMIGLVELLARDAWLRMTQGPLAGKEFLVFKDTMKIGSSPKSDIYLFNDTEVAGHHATLRAVGDECEIDSAESFATTLLNGRPVRRSRLRHGDEITIGRTVFLFQKRQG
jgi:hypothetical protein